MGKTKRRANGDGEVFPRKDKAGRLPATGGLRRAGREATLRLRQDQRRGTQGTKNRFQNVAYASIRLERTLAPSKYTTSGAADD
jgi:hypothetical protein